ncbi:Putative integral membrane protein conserved region (DUF2404), partial [Musa troglodytarum]
MLSNTRRPSYMCEISCTGLDLGSVLPYIHRMRVFPVDLNQVLSMEIDIEYSGGIEHYGNQLKSSSNSATGMGNRNEVDKA